MSALRGKLPVCFQVQGKDRFRERAPNQATEWSKATAAPASVITIFT